MIKAKLIDIDGLKLIYERTNVNNMFSLIPYFRTGSITENDDNCGITHFLEHMFKKRTTNLTTEQIAEKLRVYIPSYNARTGETFMSLDCLASLRYIDEAIKLVSDMVQNTKYIDDDVINESKVIEQEIGRYEIQNSFIAMRNLYKIIYNYPFVKNHILGTREKVLSYRACDLQKRHDELVTKENMVLSFAGNVSEEEVVRLVKKYYNNVPSNKKTKLERPEIKINGKEDIVIHVKPEDNNIIINVALSCNCTLKEEKQRILTSFLHRYLNSRGYPMFEIMRNKKALVYSYGTMIDGYDLNEVFIFSFQSSKENIKECINTLAEIIDDIYTNGIKEIYFNDIKQSKIVSYDATIDTPYNTAMGNVENYADGLNFFDLEKHLQNIENVTIEEFNEFVKNFFKSDFVCASLVGNCCADDIQTLDELRAMFYKK